MNMIKELTNRGNLNRAYKQVFKNRGSGGIDGMEVKELRVHLKENTNKYIEQIESGTYQVSPILGIEIPKSNDERMNPKGECPVDIQ